MSLSHRELIELAVAAAVLGGTIAMGFRAYRRNNTSRSATIDTPPAANQNAGTRRWYWLWLRKTPDRQCSTPSTPGEGTPTPAANPHGAAHAGESAHESRWGKFWFWFGVIVTSGGIVVGIMWFKDHLSKDTPVVVQKVIGPTEVLYRLEVRNLTGALVPELTGNYFRMRIKGDSFFEGYHPTRNNMDGPKMSFSERLGSGENGKWKDPDSGLGSGYFKVWEGEYHPALKETIHAWFWNKGMDPAKDQAWTMTLIPTEVLVTNWTHQ